MVASTITQRKMLDRIEFTQENLRWSDKGIDKAINLDLGLPSDNRFHW